MVYKSFIILLFYLINFASNIKKSEKEFEIKLIDFDIKEPNSIIPVINSDKYLYIITGDGNTTNIMNNIYKRIILKYDLNTG